MQDLLDYNRFRIETLQSRVCELETLVNLLQVYCFELADDECTLEYKNLVKSEIYRLITK
jgi:hypothetical protein